MKRMALLLGTTGAMILGLLVHQGFGRAKTEEGPGDHLTEYQYKQAAAPSWSRFTRQP
jgi:hypothetical protein